MAGILRRRRIFSSSLTFRMWVKIIFHMILRKGYRFRLLPTQIQLISFVNFAGACRYIFNYGLDRRKKAYEEGKSLRYFDQNKELTHFKGEDETSWLREIHSQILQQALKDLDQAFKHFFRRVKLGQKPGFPRFKAKGIHDSFRYPQGFHIDNDRVFLPKIGWVRFLKSRDIPGEIKQVTVSRRGDHWYVSFSCEITKTDPIFAPIIEEKAVGIDMGINYFATLAIGSQNTPQYIPNPRFLNTLLPRLKILSKRLSKKVKGSKNWIKAKRQLAKLHAKIKHARENFAHQLSSQIVKSHDIICVEGLNVITLLQQSSRGLSRSISDAGWRQFLNYLKYKAIEQGKYFVETGKFFPSTQLCSACNHRQKMSLNDREYHCESCGQKINRDLNSAILEKAAGMSALKACGATLVGGSIEAGILRL